MTPARFFFKKRLLNVSLIHVVLDMCFVVLQIVVHLNVLVEVIVYCDAEHEVSSRDNVLVFYIACFHAFNSVRFVR